MCISYLTVMEKVEVHGGDGGDCGGFGPESRRAQVDGPISVL